MRIDTPEALQAVLRADYPLSAQQFAAVTAPLEPGVVVAGAGSGKTTLMAARVVWLVATGQVAPEQVLGLTFTNKAAGELRVRVRDALLAAGLLGDDSAGGEALDPTVATYNAYAGRLLEEQGLRIGYEPDMRVLADATRYQLAARAVARHTGEIRLLSDSPAHVVGWILQLDGQLAEHLRSPRELREFDIEQARRWREAMAQDKAPKRIQEGLDGIAKRGELLGLVEDYRELKRRLGVVEFSEQIQLAAELAGHSAVGEAERDRFRVVLLDEYQDTSVAQALFLRRLFGGGHPVTAVGDPHQAIYGWRGASVSNILRFGEDFSTMGGHPPRVYPLTVNRRSDRRILGVANALVGEEVLEPSPTAATGEVRVAVHPTYAEELEALAVGVKEAHERFGSWREIGVLTRDNATAADAFRALTLAGIPVEIVGLKGLVDLPEVSELVATLRLLHDLTDSAALLALLTGARWAIGPRDLALLGRRARRLAGRIEDALERTFDDELDEAAAGVDPLDVVCLADALDDPGDDIGYSLEARTRLALLSEELRMLRRHTGEPLLDLVRRIVDVTGIDVELASSVSPSARARRDNLDLFLKAVAEFRPVDGDATLGALLAWLEAEDEFGAGLDVATPTDADSVKLLTVHRAKGLEYDAVFCVGVAAGRFPSTRGRSRWVKGQAVLPSPLRGDARDLPALGGTSSKDIAAFEAASKAYDQGEELRLAYVAFTRARRLLSVSSYLWQPGRMRPNGPSDYQRVVRAAMERWGQEPERWIEPEQGDTNPIGSESLVHPWPAELRTREVERRIEAAAMVLAATDGPDKGLADDEAAIVAGWDADLERLLAEARGRAAGDARIALPPSLTATSLVRLRDDPSALAESIARPMPRRPSSSARFGTRFHAWVEGYFVSSRQELLLDPDDLPGRGDVDIADDRELAELIERFRAGRFQERGEATVEAPFALVLGGGVVRGRIDAVFREPAGSEADWLLVDWKTSRHHAADPLQLAVYRVAWSELTGTPPERIRAGFYYVRDDRLVEPADLPDRAGLEALLSQA